MSNKTVIIPKPLSIEEIGNTFIMQTQSVSIHIEGKFSEDTRKKIQTAFYIAGVKTSEDGFPVYIEINSSNDNEQINTRDESYSLQTSEERIIIKAEEKRMKNMMMKLLMIDLNLIMLYLIKSQYFLN